MTLLSMLMTPLGLATDIATYTLANAQYDAGQTEDPNVLVSVDPQNISLNRKTKLTWWPRSYGSVPRATKQFVGYFGIDLNAGQTMRWIVRLGWLLAISLWTCFFWQSASRNALPWLIAILMCARYSTANLFLFDGGEYFYWCVFPAVLLVNLAAIKNRSSNTSTIALAMLAGFCAPCLVFCKYSAGLSAVAFAVAWVWMAYQKQIRASQLFYWGVGAGTATAIVFWLQWLPSGNPTQIDSPMQWTPILWGLGAWLFAMTDLGTLVNKFTVDILPAMGNHHDGSEGWLFLPFIFLVLLILRRENGKTNTVINPIGRQFAVIHLIGFTLLLVAMLVRGSAIHMDTRFLRPAAIALMPWIIPPLASRVVDGITKSIRISAGVLLVLLVIVPCTYGVAAMWEKAWSLADVGPNGLRHASLDLKMDSKMFFADLLAVSSSDDVIYVIDPALGIPLVSRRLFTEEHASLRTKEELAQRTFNGRPQGRLLIPLPQFMIDDGRAIAIRDSFKDISHWTTSEIHGQPRWILLIGSTE
ncbi:MAG TPA: hypothetical protein EYM79_00450 [Planctomycetes bacterium]|nr:hypothetical protein [Planctomycetota bacterium]